MPVCRAIRHMGICLARHFRTQKTENVMRSTLHIKFALLYIIFAFLGIFTTATLGRQLLLDRIAATNSESLYQEANLIASNYLPS